MTPNGHYRGRTAPLTSKRFILYIYSTNIGTEYFKHDIYSPFFSSSTCSLFHNSNVFGSCIIYILYTGCAKIKKKSGSKRLTFQSRKLSWFTFKYCFQEKLWGWVCLKCALPCLSNKHCEISSKTSNRFAVYYDLYHGNNYILFNVISRWSVVPSFPVHNSQGINILSQL